MRSMFNAAGCVPFQPIDTRRLNAPECATAHLTLQLSLCSAHAQARAHSIACTWPTRSHTGKLAHTLSFVADREAVCLLNICQHQRTHANTRRSLNACFLSVPMTSLDPHPHFMRIPSGNLGGRNHGGCMKLCAGWNVPRDSTEYPVPNLSALANAYSNLHIRHVSP